MKYLQLLIFLQPLFLLFFDTFFKRLVIFKKHHNLIYVACEVKFADLNFK